MHPSDRPIIIVGPLRSGTTLLRLLLDHHPRIALADEFEELTRYIGAADIPSAATLKRALRTDRHARLKGLEFPDHLDYVGVARSFARQAYERYGRHKPLYGFTVHNAFERLPELFPDAIYIHCVRDPRDVARSCIGMGWVGTVYHGADYWLRAERSWEKLALRVPAERRVEIRYERLVTDPVRELASLCGFLDIPFNDAMLRFHLDSTYDPIDASLAEQWRRKLSEREVEHVEYRCRELMEGRGYALSRPLAPPGAIERAALFAKNRAGRARWNATHFGVPLYLQWVLSRRLPFESYRDAVQLRINDALNELMA